MGDFCYLDTNSRIIRHAVETDLWCTMEYLSAAYSSSGRKKEIVKYYLMITKDSEAVTCCGLRETYKRIVLGERSHCHPEKLILRVPHIRQYHGIHPCKCHKNLHLNCLNCELIVWMREINSQWTMSQISENTKIMWISLRYCSFLPFAVLEVMGDDGGDDFDLFWSSAIHHF